jgi:transcriptional regulatory protein GAL4
MEDWYNSLPHYFKQPITTPESDNFALVRNRLMWRHWNLRILLYRPILLRWASRRWTPTPGSPPEPEDPLETECRMLCLRNARWTISSISDFVNNHICTRLGAWYMLYVPLPPSSKMLEAT